jgi:uncharacterized protein YjbI with pentapeptide repeats
MKRTAGDQPRVENISGGNRFSTYNTSSKIAKVENSIGLHFEHEGHFNNEVIKEMFASLRNEMEKDLVNNSNEKCNCSEISRSVVWDTKENSLQETIVKSMANFIEENKFGGQATFQSNGTPSVTCRIQSLGNKTAWEFGQITYEFYSHESGTDTPLFLFKHHQTFSLTNKGEALTFPTINGEDEENKKELDLCGAVLPKAQFKNVCSQNLSKANLAGSSLENVNFSQADGQEANLSSAVITGDFEGANFSYANLSNIEANLVNFSGANLSFSCLSRADLQYCNLQYANLSGADLSGVDLSYANLADANLAGASLSEVNLKGANLAGANLASATLFEVDLKGADLSGANLSHTSLEDLDLSNLNLSHTNLENANLACANLSEANLSNADLSRANLRDAVLISSDLTNATLTKTCFVRTVLYDAVLTGSNLEDAIVANSPVNKNSQLPDEFPRPFFHPEDIIGRDSVWFFSAENPFAKSMAQVAVRLKLNFYPLSITDKWLRDVFYKSNVGNVEEPMKVYRAPMSGTDPDETEGYPLHPSEESAMKNHRFSYVHAHNVLAGIPKEMEGEYTDAVRVFKTEEIPECIIHLPHHGSCFIEGGNIFIAAGKNGKRQCFIGNDSIIYNGDVPNDVDLTEQYEKHKASIDRSYPNVSDINKKTVLWLNRKTIKKQIMTILGVEKLTVIPQIFFHIDLQMAYLGENTFIVHSYEETLKFLKKDAQELMGKIGEEKFHHLYSVNENLAKIFEENVNVATKRLEKAGMKVVKCCATLFTGKKGEVPINGEGKITGGLMSSFINGVTAVAEDGTKHFIAIEAPENMNLHQRYMQEILSKNNVILECIKIDPESDYSSAIEFMEDQEGAVRCLTNSNLIDVINHNIYG